MNLTQTTTIFRNISKLLTGFLLISSLNGNGQNQNFPKEINLVFDYLINKDYPESFKGKESFQFRPVGWQILDINDDGITEVFSNVSRISHSRLQLPCSRFTKRFSHQNR